MPSVKTSDPPKKTRSARTRRPSEEEASRDSGSAVAGLLGEIQYRMTDLFGALAKDGARSLRSAKGLADPGTLERLLPKIARMAAKLEEFDLDTLLGMKSVLDSTLALLRETLARRGRGGYDVDEFGMDQDFVDLARPLIAFLYHKWWRVETTGIENIPAEGPVLFVANHSGVLPWDGAMLAYSVWSEHPAHRTVRALYLDWFQSIPFIQPFLARTGQVHACPENAERLLRSGNAVAVFPEGAKGVGKLFKDRYKLARFGRGGFVRIAIRSRAPIVPVSIVGAEEIYPNLMRIDPVGRLIGAPFFPITPTFPWLGLLGLVPLPSKWHLHFGEAVPTDETPERDASNFLVVSRTASEVRETIQQRIRKLLLRRESVFG